MTDPLYELLTPYFSSSPTDRPPPNPSDTTTSKYLSRLATLPLSALTSDEPTSLSQSTHSNLLALQSLSARSTTALVASSTHLTSLRSTLPLLASSASSLRHQLPDLDAQAVAFSNRYSRTREENELLDRRKRVLLLARNVDRLSDILDLPTLLESAIASSSSVPSSSPSSAAAAAATGPNLTGSGGTSSSAAPTPSSSSYASALDLHSHIKRLHLLYPDSPLVSSIFAQTESAMRDLTSNLIQSLRSQNIKLAAGMRTIGWLRRVAPELDGSSSSSSPSTLTKAGGSGGSGGSSNSEGSLGALFLVCRLGTLMGMLSALAPLQDLADQETELRLRNAERSSSTTKAETGTAKTAAKGKGGGAAAAAAGRDSSLWASGQQTERYLKRFIEIFREQSFAIVSMYRSIFPSAAEEETSLLVSSSRRTEEGDEGDPTAKWKSRGLRASPLVATSANGGRRRDDDGDGQGQSQPRRGLVDPLTPIPSALATFPMHLVHLLVDTLRAYLPNVRDKSSRESLLTQVLYCAGSLGRLGGDFGLMLADLGRLGGEDEDREGGEKEDEAEEDEEDAEWVAVMKRHRVLAGKLEKMASGGGK